MSVRESVKEYFKFILVILGLAIFYGFNMASNNESSVIAPTVEVQNDISSTVDHSSLYILDNQEQSVNIDTNNQDIIFIVLLISGILIIISLLLAEIVMRLT